MRQGESRCMAMPRRGAKGSSNRTQGSGEVKKGTPLPGAFQLITANNSTPAPHISNLSPRTMVTWRSSSCTHTEHPVHSQSVMKEGRIRGSPEVLQGRTLRHGTVRGLVQGRGLGGVV